LASHSDTALASGYRGNEGSAETATPVLSGSASQAHASIGRARLQL
jgi:hypothetical protein